MSTDPDFTPPEHLSFDEAAERYAETPDFLSDAINALAQSDPALPLPDHLASALADWYVHTVEHTAAVQHFVDEAAR